MLYFSDFYTQYRKLNTILNHTEVYHFAKGKLILHLRYDFENSDNCDTVGKTLRYYRLHRGYSTRELAEKVGVVPATLTLYENDKHPIKYKTAVLLAEVLGIDRKLLFDEYIHVNPVLPISATVSVFNSSKAATMLSIS